MRAAEAVAPNLPYPPQEHLSVRANQPLARSKCRCRRRGTPPRRDADCGSQWRFLRLRACAPPRILGGVDIWRIDGLLTPKLYRNGCIRWAKPGVDRIDSSGSVRSRSGFAHTKRSRLLYNRSAQMTHRSPASRQKIPPRLRHRCEISSLSTAHAETPRHRGCLGSPHVSRHGHRRKVC